MSKLVIVGFFGDSITGCTAVGVCWPYQYLGATGIGDCGSPSSQAGCQYYGTISGVPVVAKNLAISGTRLNTGSPSITSQATGYGDPMVTGSGGAVGSGGVTPIPTRKFIAVFMPGSNDGCINGTVAQFAADVATWAAARKAAGWHKRILCTPVTRGDGVLAEPNRQIYLSIVNAAGWAAANNIDAIADFGNDSIMGNPANLPLNNGGDTTYFNSDNTHPTTVGHARLAPILHTILDPIIAAV